MCRTHLDLPLLYRRRSHRRSMFPGHHHGQLSCRALTGLRALKRIHLRLLLDTRIKLRETHMQESTTALGRLLTGSGAVVDGLLEII